MSKMCMVGANKHSPGVQHPNAREQTQPNVPQLCVFVWAFVWGKRLGERFFAPTTYDCPNHWWMVNTCRGDSHSPGVQTTERLGTNV